MKALAILCSDLHLSLQQPACRADKDWMKVQADYLEQLNELAKDHGVPVICAGDIFDRWNPPPELLHFALENLPNQMLCVPGQHDLPNHNLEEMHRSGYGVLVKARKIVDMSGPTRLWTNDKFMAWGFGWGQDLTPMRRRKEGLIHIAVVHQYIWFEGKGYPGAPEEAKLPEMKARLAGYDAAVFGDNHQGFLASPHPDGKNVCWLMNCGTFIRRKADEMDYRPQVGLLLENGNITRHRLEIDEDRFHEKAKEREEVALNMQEFINGLEGLGEHGLNFKEAVENHLRDSELDQPTRNIILRSLETDNN